MVSQPSPTEVELVAGSPETSSRVAELEAEIAQLRDALARRQQIGVATGLLAQRFGISPERAWSLMVRLSQNGHVKVRVIAQDLIDAHCGRLDPIEIEILSSIEKHLPDGVRLVQTREDGHRPIKEHQR
jgi:ATP-dependent Clp protease adapter protein ClpS